MSENIIIIDDEQDFLDSLKRGLFIEGFKNVSTENDSVKAAERFTEGEKPDIAIIDITMPGLDGISLLEIIKEESPDTEVIMVTARNEVKTAVECLKKGAYDYLVKPISRNDLTLTIRTALERKKQYEKIGMSDLRKKTVHKNPDAFKSIITKSNAFQKILREAELHAQTDIPVLITGDSGTGKELLSGAIHLASPRNKNKFTAVNVSSISHSLFESEFFGHVKGAFTGAEKERPGYIEYTNGGTILLDEIGTLPVELQSKLLRLLESKEYMKVGSNRTEKSNVRFIASTNEDLGELVKAGKFRKDLYYRLRVAWLHIPPLTERREDIPLLIDSFIELFVGKNKKPIVEDDFYSVLCEYNYPGNVRELKSIIQSTLNLVQKNILSANLLPEYIFKTENQKNNISFSTKLKQDKLIPLEEIEKDHILKVYESAGKNKVKTARILEIGLNTLHRKLKLYNIK